MTPIGPYVVEVRVKRPICVRYGKGWVPTYREAFATLEEAREAVLDLIWTCEHYSGRDPEPDLQMARDWCGRRLAIPLPDGREVVVEATRFDVLIQQLGPAGAHLSFGRSTDAEILAAWNAERGIGIERSER